MGRAAGLRCLARNPQPLHIAAMAKLSPRLVALFSLLTAGLALGIAFASEYWGGLVPCALCLWERWPYRVAIGLAILALIFSSRLLLGLVALAGLAGAALAAIHVGVEQGFWPSPLPECAARLTFVGSIAERMAALPARPAKPCDEPSFLIPSLPLSMAMMNLLFALAFVALLAIYLRQAPIFPRQARGSRP
jgi:disulfide bond formation protein DsbB